MQRRATRGCGGAAASLLCAAVAFTGLCRTAAAPSPSPLPSPPTLVGSWTTFIDALPHNQLPHVPMAGNGHVGVVLDSRATSRAGAAPGPGRNASLDVWINSQSMWSCVDRAADAACSSVDPDDTSPACCSVVALGGLSLRLGGGDAPLPAGLAFSAEQRIGAGVLATTWRTPAGGTLNTTTVVLPDADAVLTNATWSPGGAGDPAVLRLDVALWVLGAATAKGTWNTGGPAPASVGCGDATGAPAPCDGRGSTAPLLVASRAAATAPGAVTVMPVFGALAAGVVGSPPAGVGLLSTAVTGPPGSPPADAWEATAAITVAAGATASVWVGVAHSRGPGAHDPAPDALAAVAPLVAGGPAAVAAASASAAAWWAAYWGRSSLSLPSRPAVEALWHGSLYALAGFASPRGDVPGPGLYGPWATQDGPNWHGDYTLDYNYQAPYFGAGGANHADLLAGSVVGPIADWQPPARRKAAAQAALAGVACPAAAQYFACHLAPWGLLSLDPMVRYMTWNGAFAALPLLSAVEYAQNASFALSVVYPLLEGLSAWYVCYLNRTASPGGSGYVYDDANGRNPDYEHEGQPVPNPQIALALIARVAAATLELADALGLPPPAGVADVATHLAPFNAVNYSGPVPGAANVTLLPDTRCHDDSHTWYDVGDAAACGALCAAAPGCALMSYCPPDGTDGCTGAGGEPRPHTCWGFTADKRPGCTAAPGWTSGVVTAAPAPPGTQVWTAYRGAGVGDSDWFALYPVWPAEVVDGPSPLEAGDPDAAATRARAQASSRLYSDFVGGRPVDLFAMAVRAGGSGSGNASGGLAPWTPAQVLDGLGGFLAGAWGPNLLPYAPGGGIENAGIIRAVHEMLLASARVPPAARRRAGAAGSHSGLCSNSGSGGSGLGAYVHSLFPFWPADEPASFSTLLAKGGFTFTAAYDNATRAVAPPVRVTAAHVWADAPSARLSLAHPWPGAGVAVDCGGGGAVPVQWALNGTVLSFDAPSGVECTVAPAPPWPSRSRRMRAREAGRGPRARRSPASHTSLQ